MTFLFLNFIDQEGNDQLMAKTSMEELVKFLHQKGMDDKINLGHFSSLKVPKHGLTPKSNQVIHSKILLHCSHLGPPFSPRLLVGVILDTQNPSKEKLPLNSKKSAHMG